MRVDSTVDYDHEGNLHTLDGARAALPILLGDRQPKSLLDVGCGAGTWLRAALDCGVEDLCGLDGVHLPVDKRWVPDGVIRVCDLTQDWGLGRMFDVVLCLEVAEHLPLRCAESFIKRLTQHGHVILFSAANRWQRGQHHVNCQWPDYWQGLFNRYGFTCDAAVRWQLWDDARVEPWYRQNIFLAAHAPEAAGQEPRIAPVVHPDYLPTIIDYHRREQQSWLAANIEHVMRCLRARRPSGSSGGDPTPP